MSVSVSCYIGPYVRCLLKPKVVDKQSLVCLRATCKKHHKPTKEKFCGGCGSEIGILVEQEAEYPDLYNLVKDDLTTLQYDPPEDKVLFLGSSYNIKLGKGIDRNLHPDPEEGINVNLAEVEREAELLWFTTKFSKQLEVLKENSSEFEYGWGLHIYYS